VKINRTVIGFPDFHTKLVQAAATGKFPDIAAIDNADVPVFASQGALADVMQYFEVAEGPVPAGRAGKHQIQRQGLRHPVPEQHHALWYNQDAFIEAGITTRRSRPERLAPYLFVLPAILYPGALLVYPIAVNVLTSFQQLTAINLLSGTRTGSGWATTAPRCTTRSSFRGGAFRRIHRGRGGGADGAGLGARAALQPGLSRRPPVAFVVSDRVCHPVVVSAQIFRWMLDGRTGFVNRVLQVVHLQDPVYWLADTRTALPPAG